MGAFTRQRNSDYDGENMNVNVTWVSYPLFWAFYVLSIGLFRWALIFVPDTYISPEYAWTVTSIVHGVVSFLMIHQSKGTPVWADQGAYNDLTFWEQIDGGRPWTPARKVFLIVPILLFLLVSHATEYDLPQLVVNLITCGVLVVAKLPEMMFVRILGRKPEAKD